MTIEPTRTAPCNTLGLCETQPATAEGLRALLGTAQDIRLLWSVGSLPLALELARRDPPGVVLLDKAFGYPALLNALAEMERYARPAVPVIWGTSWSESEALRLLQSGTRGLIRKTADLATVLACLRAVGQGLSWVEEGSFRENSRLDRSDRSELTSREQQVLELVEQGMKNREIARELGIQPGTVKIHLKHIFEKTGVRGRYGLALSGLRERGMLSPPIPRQSVA